jgi:hypothetical protein
MKINKILLAGLILLSAGNAPAKSRTCHKVTDKIVVKTVVSAALFKMGSCLSDRGHWFLAIFPYMSAISYFCSAANDIVCEICEEECVCQKNWSVSWKLN